MLKMFVPAVVSKTLVCFVTPTAPVVSTSLVTLLPAVIPVLSDALKPARAVAVETALPNSRLSVAALPLSFVSENLPEASSNPTV